MLGTTVALGLGSNLGQPLEHLRSALAALRKLQNFKVISVSSIFESDALMPDNAPADWNKKYLNAVVLVETEGKPEPVSWLQSLKKIESEIGRKSGETWAPREIDIDILYWNREPFQTPELNIPHARLTERPFALLPLLEVWPELRSLLDLPLWAQPWAVERPFNTQFSGKVWPRLVGILNITPDSFSDGGRWLDEDSVQNQLQYFAENGVDIVDVGAESTRPHAQAVSPEEELERLKFGFEILKHSGAFQISLDSRRGEVAESILAKYRVDFLNDVAGFESASMQRILRESGRKAFVMHSLGIPPVKEQVLPEDKNPFSELTAWWEKKCRQLENIGVHNQKLIFDPGIGFGKTPAQSFYLLRHLEKFSGIKNEIMIGHSRKSFLSVLTKKPAPERDIETALVTQTLNQAHVQYLRIHDPVSQLTALKARSFLC